MMRNPQLRNPELKAIEIEDIEDLNPEWQKDMEQMNKQMRELGELQMEGADTYMTAFSQLKTFSFFQEAAHWFYLFSLKVPDLYRIYKGKTFSEKSLLGLMISSPAFCDSDKYSFCLATQSLPHDQQTFMRSKLNGEDLIPNDLNLNENLEEQKLNTVQRQYIHNLYRFYKLWRFRQEMHDIFKDKLDFWNNSLLRPLILKESIMARLRATSSPRGTCRKLPYFMKHWLKKTRPKRKSGKNWDLPTRKTRIMRKPSGPICRQMP